MATAKKLPSGSWRVRVYTGTVDGKKKYTSTTADTKKKAELMAAQYSLQEKMDDVVKAIFDFRNMVMYDTKYDTKGRLCGRPYNLSMKDLYRSGCSI